MNIIKAINDNPYLGTDTSESSLVKLLEPFSYYDFNFIYTMIKYPATWTYQLDLFQYLSEHNLQKLRNDPKTFFIYNFEREGFQPDQYLEVIYYNCRLYNISPEKIIYASSNLYEEKAVSLYNKQHDIDQSIHVIPYMFFRYKDFRDYPIDPDLAKTNPDYYKKFCNDQVTKLHNGNYCLSLSRVHRFHRSLIQFLLSTDEIILPHLIASHRKLGKLGKKNTIYDFREFDIDRDLLDKWIKSLPMNPDSIDFAVNQASTIDSHLRFDALFELVNETLYDNNNGNCLFYSEKTFKPMFHLQPFIIFGQQHCNKRLQDYGFKIYDNVFDYSFDDEPDLERRCKLIVSEIRRITNYLNSITLAERFNWREKCNDIALHNLQIVSNTTDAKQQIAYFLENLL